MTGYWEESQDDSLSIRKAKKRTKQEDDHDWTIDEEYVPVSRRGRPRGTKNKPKVAMHNSIWQVLKSVSVPNEIIIIMCTDEDISVLGIRLKI